MKFEIQKKKILYPYELIIAINFILWLIFSWSFYENYNITQNDISNLGVPNLNPEGWFFWGVAMATTGILFIPILPFTIKKLIEKNKILGYISSFFFIIAAYGMIGLGIFPQIEGLGLLHQFHAGFAFGGLYLGCFFGGIILLMDPLIKRWKNIILILCGWFAPTGFVITQIYRLASGGHGKECAEGICPWYLSFPTWEWMLLFGIFITILLLIAFIPENKSIPSKDDKMIS